ncbi:MAG: phospho-N-acetylmuramoyl-pentapeptide-transferase [Tepidisphaeraceae bacterium]
MLALLIRQNLAWLEAHGLGFLRLFTFVTFQTVVALMASFVIVLGLGPRVIAWLRHQKIGDNPEFDQADINKAMDAKRGTPTMGGVLIVGAIVATCALVADVSNFYVVLAIGCTLFLAMIGAVDDWMKLHKQRRAKEAEAAGLGKQAADRQGLRSKEKLILQLCLGAVLAFLTYRYGGDVAESHRLYIPFMKFGENFVTLPLWIYVLFGTLLVSGFSNAVNLTDGLDGLAAGLTAIVSFVLMVLSLIIGDDKIAATLLYHHHPFAGQMSVVCGSIAGACLGFLWFNCNPAKVFMGDTGSLALGGLLGYIALVLRQEILLILLGAIFVVEALSVLIQVSYFKYTKKKYGEGRRIFRMAPIHHHFQKLGWSETTVVVRFWLIGAMLAFLGLATINVR